MTTMRVLTEIEVQTFVCDRQERSKSAPPPRFGTVMMSQELHELHMFIEHMFVDHMTINHPTIFFLVPQITAVL